MAESEFPDCPCSNISIMQLFHELKQKFPTVPDQIVSKIIQQNFHDKKACLTILKRESHNFVQSYPGALISGGATREANEVGPLCDRCPVPRIQSNTHISDITNPAGTTTVLHHNKEESDVRHPRKSILHRLSPTPDDYSKRDIAEDTVQVSFNTQTNQVLSESNDRLRNKCAFDKNISNSVRSLSNPCISRSIVNKDSQMVSNERVKVPYDKCDAISGKPYSISETKNISTKVPTGKSWEDLALERSLTELLKLVTDKEIEDSCNVSNSSESVLNVSQSSLDTLVPNVGTSEEDSSEVVNFSDNEVEIKEKLKLDGKTECVDEKKDNDSIQARVEKRNSDSEINIEDTRPHVKEDHCNIPRSQSCYENRSDNYSKLGCRRKETRSWSVEENGRYCNIDSGNILMDGISAFSQSSPHNYQVNVKCSVQPVSPSLWLNPGASGDQKRSFTSVNLTLRPPSSEPQLPIEIHSGQGLTYSTSSYDPRQGFQSQLQIRIGPGGGGTVSACRTLVAPPGRISSRSPTRAPQLSSNGACKSRHHHCHNKPQTRALLEKQRERRDQFAKELNNEKEKLRTMKNRVKRMKADLTKQPSPQLLPKLKAEIIRLRAECKRLTSAVDHYSDVHHNLPLGETDEEFYRPNSFYTGQRIRREGNWSCQTCTFRNHPLLTVCEECEMPRITTIGTTNSDVPAVYPASLLSNIFNNSTFCGGAGTSTSTSLTTAPLQE